MAEPRARERLTNGAGEANMLDRLLVELAWSRRVKNTLKRDLGEGDEGTNTDAEFLLATFIAFVFHDDAF